MNKLLEYLERKDSENEKIRMMAIAHNDYLYGIEVRFSAALCESDRDTFNKITNVVNRRSGGVLKVVSTWEEFFSGIISFRVAFCNNAYADKQVMECMDLFVKEILLL